MGRDIPIHGKDWRLRTEHGKFGFVMLKSEIAKNRYLHSSVVYWEARWWLTGQNDVCRVQRNNYVTHVYYPNNPCAAAERKVNSNKKYEEKSKHRQNNCFLPQGVFSCSDSMLRVLSRNMKHSVWKMGLVYFTHHT